MMRYIYTQSGAALIILLTVFILGSITLLLSQLNERTHFKLDDQRQTIRALNQAKEALLGYAATYAQQEDHDVKLQGYLPCPDMNGDGMLKIKDGEGSCSGEGQTVIGRLPWTTLGLPPLRDGSGECLWYAVSGHFKSNPKVLDPALNSDTDGKLIVKNAQGEIITDKAIAIVFAPSHIVRRKPYETEEQERAIVTGTPTECGSETEEAVAEPEPINHIKNYLDRYDYEGVELNNATGNGTIFFQPSSTGKSGFFATSPDTATPEFISASPVYETVYKADGSKEINRGIGIFNDTLITITPKDFKPVYREMDYQVARQVKMCLERAAQKNFYHFIEKTDSFIDKLIDDKYLEDKYLIEENRADILNTIKNLLILQKPDLESDNFRGTPYPKYPWASSIDNYDSKTGNHFGRIPTNPVFFEKPTDTDEIYLLKTQKVFIDVLKEYIKKSPNCTSEDPIQEENCFIEFKDNKWKDLWKTRFELELNMPDKWPIDPQWPFLILDLHSLEYDQLSLNEDQIPPLDKDQLSLKEIKTRTLSTLENEVIKKAFAEHYLVSEDKVYGHIKDINDKTKLIGDIKTVSQNVNVTAELDKYRCFSFSSSDQKWWWWKKWRERVFFAIHSDYSPNNSSENPLTFKTDRQEGTEKKEDTNEVVKVNINTEMLVLVAGRALVDLNQDRTQTAVLDNYLEDENKDGKPPFEHKSMTNTFNDVVL